MSECEALNGHSERCREFYSLSSRNLCDAESDLRSELAAAKAETELNKAAYKTVMSIGKNLGSELASAKAEIEGLKESMRFTYCAYCGWKSPVDDNAADLTDHVESCVRHPVFIAKSENKRLRGALEWMFSSYKLSVAGKSVRCLDEVFVEAQSALDGKGGEA